VILYRHHRPGRGDVHVGEPVRLGDGHHGPGQV